MSDEVQCGLGRTGKWFVYQHAGFLPDVVPLAKGLASGVPVGACVVGGRAKGVFKPGNHGSTFGGNPLAMTARGHHARHHQGRRPARQRGAGRRGDPRRPAAPDRGHVAASIRGMGLMIGVELDAPCGELVKQALDAGLVINVTADNVVRLLPPLVMSEAEGRQVVERLAPLVRAFLERSVRSPAAAAR